MDIKFIAIWISALVLILVIFDYTIGMEKIAKHLSVNVAMLIITLLSFVVAGTTLYYAHWKPFDLSVHDGGRYAIHIDKDFPKNHNLSLDLIFSNTGAVVGVVEDVYLKFYMEENKTVMLFPQYDVVGGVFNLSDQNKLEEMKYFTSFPVEGRASISKQIVFGAEDDAGFDISLGDHEVDVHVRSSDGK